MAPALDSITRYWNGLDMNAEEYRYDACQAVLRLIDLKVLAAHASKVHGSSECYVEDQFTKAGRNVVRLLTFDNGDRWIARFRMADVFDQSGPRYTLADDSLLLREVHCYRLIAQRTSIPVPRIWDHGTSDSAFGAPYIFMDCLAGSCAFDIDRSIPEQFKSTFYKQMANVQVQISNQTFPKIGTLEVAEDGSVEIGPIPGIGGPFTTAAAYLLAWADAAHFYLTEEDVRRGCGPFADEIWQSTVAFPKRLRELADRICESGRNHGPFPLFHPDFGHQNMIVDEQYNVLGVIDWEHATTVPWEVVTLPYTVTTTPPPMCPPEWYDGDGNPVDDDLKAQHHDSDTYVQAVKDMERELDAEPRLSNVLGNRHIQNVAIGMDLYVHHGKMGFYSRILDAFEG